MSEEEHFRKLERMYASGPINRYLRPTLRVERGFAELSMGVDRRLFHAAGAVHGSVYFKALDDAAFFAVNSLVRDRFVVTVEFNIYLLRPVSAGEIRATGRVAHSSSRLHVAEAELRDDRGRLLARGSGSFVESRIPLSAEVGYA
jgi:uncharacterized protein (TIGR00369 family)